MGSARSRSTRSSTARPKRCADARLVRASVVDADGEEVTLAFDDDGLGVPRRDHVFHLFQRLHAPGEYGDGTGVGLAIARRVVRITDGPLGGARMLVTLPRARPPLPEAREERRS